jgi:hypothetical protein
MADAQGSRSGLATRPRTAHDLARGWPTGQFPTSDSMQTARLLGRAGDGNRTRMTSLEVLSNHAAAGLAKRTRSSQTFFYPCASLSVCSFFSDLARGWPTHPHGIYEVPFPALWADPRHQDRVRKRNVRRFTMEDDASGNDLVKIIEWLSVGVDLGNAEMA